jgi:hypothetical protein
MNRRTPSYWVSVAGSRLRVDRDPQRRPAGDPHPDPRTRRQHGFRQAGAGINDALAVVQQQEEDLPVL